MSHAERTLPDVLRFMQLLWAVVHGIQKRSKRMTAEIGVTGPQRLVMRVAGLAPGVSAGDVAAILHLHPSTLTGILRRLIAQRLIARAEDPNDRRRAVLHLTRRGVRVNATSGGTVEAAISTALAEVSERDRFATMRVLERLASQLTAAAAGSRRRPRPRRAAVRRRGTA